MSIFFKGKLTDDKQSRCEPLADEMEVVVFLADSKATKGAFFKIRKAIYKGTLLRADPESGFVDCLMALMVESAKSPGKAYMDMVAPSQIIGQYSPELFEKAKQVSAVSVSAEDFIQRMLVGKAAGEVVFNAEEAANPNAPVPAPVEAAPVVPDLLSEEVIPEVPAPVPSVKPANPVKKKEFNLDTIDLSMFAVKSDYKN